MAVTRAGTGIGPTAGGGGMIPSYWDAVFAESLYPSLFMYQFGAKRRIPPNFGFTVKISRLKRQTDIVAAQSAASYGVPLTSFNALCSQVVSGTLAKYRGVYGNSDIALLTTLGDPTEFAIRDIARDLALQMDNAVRGVLSGISQGAPLGAATLGAITAATLLKPSLIAKGVAKLRGYNNPRWPDGNYPLLTHPFVSYDLKASLSSNAATWYTANISNDGSNAEKFFRGEVGRLYGARIIETTNVKRLNATGGMSVGQSGWQSLLLAPEAYYVCEMSEMTGRVIVKGLGSAGALDADNSLSTVAAKVFFCPIRGFQVTTAGASQEYRYLRLISGASVTQTSTT